MNKIKRTQDFSYGIYYIDPDNGERIFVTSTQSLQKAIKSAEEILIENNMFDNCYLITIDQGEETLNNLFYVRYLKSGEIKQEACRI